MKRLVGTISLRNTLCVKETKQVEILNFIQSPKYSMTQIEVSTYNIIPEIYTEAFSESQP